MGIPVKHKIGTHLNESDESEESPWVIGHLISVFDEIFERSKAFGAVFSSNPGMEERKN